METLRSTAKWLLAAFAAIAAALAAGLQLTGLGELAAGSWRLWASLASIPVTLGSLGYMATSATAVLSQDWVTLAAFTDDHHDAIFNGRRSERDFKRLERKIEANRHELYAHVAPTISELHTGLQDAVRLAHDSAAPEAQRRKAQAQASELRAAARDVVQCANYFWTRELFLRMRKHLAWASVAAILGLTVFAYAANPPKPDKPLDVRVCLASDSAASAGRACSPASDYWKSSKSPSSTTTKPGPMRYSSTSSGAISR
ncbi:hypothetical protein GCM10012280_70230 [Wenjunlia tyrosinilytica]|uniref:Uncharacterized protein n=1 Tax=Wenjunlia tyrosinilytica TaxID=1544741 RepID=A0A917ZYP1_9ACTN|nr:hypothetical protein GCM10012280_70230 [Wenjunlia tyrosinilytica]